MMPSTISPLPPKHHRRHSPDTTRRRSTTPPIIIKFANRILSLRSITICSLATT